MTTPQRSLSWIAAFAVFICAVLLFESILLPFLVGLAVAYFLDPVCDRLEQMGCSRTIATSLVTAGFFLLVKSERPMTTQPKKENCMRMAMITWFPPPPEWVPSATTRSLNKRRKSSPSRLNHAMVLFRTGGQVPLYSGAKTNQASPRSSTSTSRSMPSRTGVAFSRATV